MAVACGYAHTLALADRGFQVVACGRGNHGQLGAGTRKHQRASAPVAGLEGKPDIVMVAAGYYHSAAITSAGELLLWGRNRCGQLGQGDRPFWAPCPERGAVFKPPKDRPVPVTLGPLHFGGVPVAMVACGDHHTLVVTRDGRLFAFGSGQKGRLGLSAGDDRHYQRYEPVEVGPERLGGAIIVYAAAGAAHSCAVTSGGSVWTWGYGSRGCLGHNDERDQFVPKEIEGQFGGARALSLAAGRYHTMVLTTCGVVWGCGAGTHGQLGVGDTVDRHAPVRVGGEEAFGQSKVRMVACGFRRTVAVTEEGALWSWGGGGSLGHDDDRYKLAPARVGQERFGGAKIVTAACGVAHSAAVSEDGALFTWGPATYDGVPVGLGHDDMEDKPVPTLVAPDRLLGARIGRGLPLEPLLAVAFAMGTHRRLGAGKAAGGAGGGGRSRKSWQAAGKEPLEEDGKGSGVMALAGEPGLVKMVVELCWDWAVGWAPGKGVRRLAGLWTAEGRKNVGQIGGGR